MTREAMNLFLYKLKRPDVYYELVKDDRSHLFLLVLELGEQQWLHKQLATSRMAMLLCGLAVKIN